MLEFQEEETRRTGGEEFTGEKASPHADAPLPLYFRLVIPRPHLVPFPIQPTLGKGCGEGREAVQARHRQQVHLHHFSRRRGRLIRWTRYE